jgi:hypothetical protein
MLNSNNLGPYVSVTRDTVRKFSNGESFRVIVFGAYNAFGLIGSEFNGIAVFNENEKNVVADCIGREASGYFGPSDKQIALFDKLASCRLDTFRKLVNQADRLRYSI